MSESPKDSFKNILFTVKKYNNGKFELLYISSEIRNIIDEGEKFYREAFFEEILPTLPRPFFQYLFKILGNGDKVICPLVWKKQLFQFVQLEGYVISQENYSYLINVLISPLPPNKNIKVSWLLDKSKNGVYVGKGELKNPENISEWEKYFIAKFDFIDKNKFSEFMHLDSAEILTVFPDHLYLTKQVLNKEVYLIQLEYGSSADFKGYQKPSVIGRIANNNRVIYYEYDVDSDLFKVSGGFEDILGYPVHFFDDFSGKDWINLIHPEDRHYFNHGFEHYNKLVYRMLHSSGHYIYVKDENKKFEEQPNQKNLVFGIITDITALKEIEKDLLEHKTVLDELTGVVPGMVYLLKAYADGRRNFIFVSEGSYNLLGLEASTIMENYLTLKGLIHPDDIENVTTADKDAFTKDQKFESNFRIITPSGETKWIYGASNRLNKYQNESIWAGFFVDVTYTKQKEIESFFNLNKYKTLFNENPLPIFQYDREGVIQDVNKRFIEKIDVMDPSLLLGKNLFDIVGNHPIKVAYEDSIKKGYGFYEGPYVSNFNKKLFHVRVNAKSVDENGLFQAILEDISEEQYVSNILSELTERTSRYSGQKFFNELTSFLAGKLSMSYCFIAKVNEKDHSAEILSIYAQGKKQKNYSYNLKNTPCEKCLDSNSPFIIHNRAFEKFPEDKTLFDLGISTYLGIPITDIEKNRLGILVLMDEKPHPYSTGLSGLLTVLSDRVGAELSRLNFENRLIASEQLFRSIAENFPKGIIAVLDKDFNYIYTDGKGYRTLGIDPKNLIGTSHMSMYENENIHEIEGYFKKVLNGEAVVFEVGVDKQYYLKNGVPLVNDKGIIDRILLVSQNITEIKISESEREQLIRDLKSQNEELQRFAYIISHNLRAPIVNISSLLDLYNSSNPSDIENYEIIENLKISTDILHSTLEDLIEVVSIKKNKLPKIEEVSFKMLVRNIEKSLSKQIKESGTILRNNFTAAPNINYIYSHLENFLINLTTNAIKYRHAERDPIIEIKTYRKNNFTVIEFRDNGIGIDLERYKDRLFGLYQRFHSHVEGKGLGLYLVREQIRAHDGNLKIESKVGEGTTIYIYLKNLKSPSSE
ncbi:PAS domain S-box-containing protein [Aquiflexum balticum DSM 16537]|uniref:histidine kinase n=1 Tax=Aquiflexum balticum DSM 16537 TaxID=758820 RepID=A0A1W2H0M6_9BACT|nr:PAS domain S-box-containing protein [Aquiflexum balticum DSM 16537]